MHSFGGKIVGALLGIALFVGAGLAWFGMALGLLVGHFFDRGLNSTFSFSPQGQKVQRVFFSATFKVLGYLAKVDGVVSRAEINAAENLMTRMRITGDMRQSAINFFNEGKDPSFNLAQCLDEFMQHCGTQRMLIRSFLEFQIQMALADGQLSSAEKRALVNIAEKLRFNAAQIERLIRFSTYSEHFRGEQHQGHHAHTTARSQLADAYATLGVTETASLTEVKRAYRKLMAQHHPDKLIAKGLPEEMMAMAKEKTQAIQSAYDLITKHRKS